MSKKQIIMAIIIAVIAVAAAFGFSSFMAGREEAWKAANAQLMALPRMMVAVAQLIRQLFVPIAVALVAGSFFVVWLLGLLFRKN
jgi:hypothetical protein